MASTGSWPSQRRNPGLGVRPRDPEEHGGIAVNHAGACEVMPVIQGPEFGGRGELRAVQVSDDIACDLASRGVPLTIGRVSDEEDVVFLVVLGVGHAREPWCKRPVARQRAGRVDGQRAFGLPVLPVSGCQKNNFGVFVIDQVQRHHYPVIAGSNHAWGDEISDRMVGIINIYGT